MITNNVFARQYPNDIRKELASRTLARKNFLDFITYTYPEYKPEAFHADLTENLGAVVTGDIPRLIIIAPPQHGKSETVSIRLPPFWIAKNPDLPVMLCSYGASLAGEKASAAREILHSDSYRILFPELFKKAPKWSRQKYMLSHYNSRIYSAGVRGPITGRGAGLGIIDDPVKSWEQAYSPGQREAVWSWWKTTFRTRIWENGRIIIIMTRWHEDDLVGRILNSSNEHWKILRYPALAESQEERDAYNKKYIPSLIGTPDPIGRSEGEPLAPGRYSLNALIALQHAVGPRAWGAEYQGSPKPVEGNLFNIAWISEHDRLVDEVPSDAQYVRYWDKAGTENAGARTAGILMCKTKDGRFYIVDMVKGQWSEFQRENMIRFTAERDAEKYNHVTTYVEMEPGSGGKESALATVKNLSGFSIHWDRPTQAKEVRFAPFCSQAEAGNVYIKKGPWTQEYIEELTLFPTNTFKDQVDATSGAFKVLNNSVWTRTI